MTEASPIGLTPDQGPSTRSAAREGHGAPPENDPDAARVSLIAGSAAFARPGSLWVVGG